MCVSLSVFVSTRFILTFAECCSPCNQITSGTGPQLGDGACLCPGCVIEEYMTLHEIYPNTFSHLLEQWSDQSRIRQLNRNQQQAQVLICFSVWEYIGLVDGEWCRTCCFTCRTAFRISMMEFHSRFYSRILAMQVRLAPTPWLAARAQRRIRTIQSFCLAPSPWSRYSYNHLVAVWEVLGFLQLWDEAFGCIE